MEAFGKNASMPRGSRAMPPVVCTADPEGRVVLPASFAGSTVVIEQVSETEVRIRKAGGPVEEGHVFEEEMRQPLSARDWAIFTDLLDNPPPPNEALKALARKHKHRG
jgi:hypothetical protein